MRAKQLPQRSLRRKKNRRVPGKKSGTSGERGHTTALVLIPAPAVGAPVLGNTLPPLKLSLLCLNCKIKNTDTSVKFPGLIHLEEDRVQEGECLPVAGAPRDAGQRAPGTDIDVLLSAGW